MPTLWTDTIDAHRHQVREAILAATAALVDEQGLRGVTMSQIAERAGIGRATLYKYFPDVETILRAWHEQQIHTHLHQLSAVAAQHNDPGQRLAAVLEAFAAIAHGSRGHRDGELAALLHADQHVAAAEEHLHGMLTGLLREAAAAQVIRDDVAPAELASYCLYALAAAAGLPSQAAVRRLVGVTLAGLQAPSRAGPA